MPSIVAPRMGGLLEWGAVAGAATTAARYLTFDPANTIFATDHYRIILPKPGFLRNLSVRHQAAGTGSLGNNTYKLNLTGVNTALTAAMDNASTTVATDVTHVILAAALDEASIEMTRASATASGTLRITCSVEYVPFY